MPVLDLIHRFLLESGFPKASIVRHANAGEPVKSSFTTVFKPAYSIVDPDNCENLAVIDVIETSDTKMVTARALLVLRYLAESDDYPSESQQGFLIQVNRDEPDESRQVIFYKLFHDRGMEAISTYAFPDLDTLKVAKKLERKHIVDASQQEPQVVTKSAFKPSISHLPVVIAALLLIFTLIDVYLVMTRGQGLLSVQQTMLVVCAALLFVIPALKAKIPL